MMESREPKELICLDRICSLEYRVDAAGNQRQVLNDLSLIGFEKQTWGIYSASAFEMRLFLDIISNIKPYQKGRCIIEGLAIRRKKQTMLPHVYVIGSTNILLEHLHVLDYLTMLCKRSKGAVQVHKRAILEELQRAGLAFICLSKIADLSPQEKALVCLFMSLYLPCRIVVFNLGRIQYDSDQIQILLHIVQRLREQQKLLLFASMQIELLEACTTHLFLMKEGAATYCGSTLALIQKHQRYSLHIEGKYPPQLISSLHAALSDCVIEEADHHLKIWMNQHEEKSALHTIYSIFQKHSCYPVRIEYAPSALKDTWNEVMG